MIRNIYVGDAYSRKVVTPLITSDCNSYKIIWDSKCTKGNFKITAIRADGTSSFDFGILSEEGLAEYIISNDMYNTEGPLKLLLAIVESDSITTCREINFTVKQGADETKFAENNINPINSLVMQMATDKTEVQEKVANLQNYGTADIYVLKDGEDIKISDGVVEEFLKKDFSGCEAIAFPEGIYEIKLPNDGLRGTTDLVANKVIMPASLKTIGEFSFANFAEFDENDKLDEKSVRVKVREYVLNEGIEKIERSAFADNVFLEKVNIPYTLTEIERMTFGYTDNLEKIFIPATVVEIGHGNFTTSQLDGENATVIYGYAGTEAERYAKNEQHWLKEYENQFVNIGSDCAPFLNASKSTETTIRANEYYSFTDISSLTVTLDTASTTKLDEFMFSFETPADISEFSFGVLTDEAIEIKWIKEPNLKPDYIYEVSVVNGVGVIAGTPKEVA